MANWIKSLRQGDGSFAIVITREVVGTDGKTATIEDFITRASPLEFANAILRAHGVEPAQVFSAALVRDVSIPARIIDTPAEPVHHAEFAPMPAFDPEQDDDEGAPGEPPRCKAGGCE